MGYKDPLVSREWTQVFITLRQMLGQHVRMYRCDVMAILYLILIWSIQDSIHAGK